MEPEQLSKYTNLKVGDTYKIKIYKGCLGIKYYKKYELDYLNK